LIHFCTASRVTGVISNCTGRWVLCCITTARIAHLVAVADVPNPEADEVAAAQLVQHPVNSFI
jgi:hypothetical protein